MILIVLIMVPTISLFSKFENYILFSPEGYEVTVRETQQEGNVFDYPIERKSTNIFLQLEKNNYVYKTHIVKFDRLRDLQTFWYSFVSHHSSALNSAITAIPLLYGEFNTLTDDELILSCWYDGISRVFYVIEGREKGVVDDLKFRLKRFN